MAADLQEQVSRFTQIETSGTAPMANTAPRQAAPVSSNTDREGHMRSSITAAIVLASLLTAGALPLQGQAILARAAVTDTGATVSDSARSGSEQASMQRLVNAMNTGRIRPTAAPARLARDPAPRPELMPSPSRTGRAMSVVDSLTEANDSLTRALSEMRDRLAGSSNELGGVRGVLDSLIRLTDVLNRRVTAVDMRATNGMLGIGSFRGSIDSLAERTDSLARAVAGVDARAAGLGNFRFSGDFRVRMEGTSQDGIVSRYRERSRARLNILGNPSGQVTAGLSISTGNTNEPQTENQTATGFFTRKVLTFDRFYLTYKPSWLNGFSLTAGRFAIPWQKTGLTYSPDLQVDGITAGLSRPVHSSLLQEVGVVGYYLPMLEVAADLDTYMRGGQLQSRWRLGPNLSARAAVGFNEVRHPDPIAVAAAGGTIVAAFPTSNTLTRDSAGKVTGYGVGFRTAEGILGLDYASSPRWPLALQLNVVSNRAAQAQRNGWLAEARLGALLHPGDLQWTYAYYSIERDAVISSFNEGDIRSGTNARAHRIQGAVRVQRNVTAVLSLWMGKLADAALTPNLLSPSRQTACTTTGDCHDPLWKRLQADVSYTF